MKFPHEEGFRFRVLLYWSCSFLSLVLAWRTPGLDVGTFLLAVLGTAILAWIVYRYALWLQRIERRFRRVHPRKFEVSVIVCFYLPLLMAVAVAWLAPRLKTRSAPTPITQAIGFLLVPVLLAGAAGIMRGAYDQASTQQAASPNGGPVDRLGVRASAAGRHR